MTDVLALAVANQTLSSSAPMAAIRKRGRRRKASAAELMAAFSEVMQAELGTEAIARWRERLAVELGQVAVPTGTGSLGRSPCATSAAVLPTTRPKLTAAVIDAMGSSEVLLDGEQVRAAVNGCIGVEGGVAKLLARRVADYLRERRATDVLCAGGEIGDEALGDPTRLAKTLSRVIQETMVCVFSAAAATRGEGDEAAVLELHTADQTLAGKPLRGCGVVYCPRGRHLFERALTEARASLEPLLSLAP